MELSYQVAREEVASASIDISQSGLVSGTWGNVSLRIVPEETEKRKEQSPTKIHFAITPSGLEYNKMNASDVAILDEEEQQIYGDRKPSSEYKLHLTTYKHRNDIGAIVHTHSPYCTAMAISRTEIPPASEDLVQIVGGGVPLAAYAFPGTYELGKNAVSSLGEGMAVLLANHGLLVCGRNLSEAVSAAEIVEKSAMATVYAQMFGGAHLLSKVDIDRMREFYLHSYKQ